jgi:5,6-dimethylbenzimidazole synthase
VATINYEKESAMLGTQPHRMQLPVWSAIAGDASAPCFDEPFYEQLLRLFAWRRDVRHFTPDPVPDEVVRHLFEVACTAPSVGLSQPWRFVLVKDEARRDQVRANFKACNQAALQAQQPSRASLYAQLKLAGLYEAPVQFALFADRATTQGGGLGRATMPETLEYSAVMAVYTLWLAARAQGIGLGWVSILEPEPFCELLEVHPAWHFIGYFCLGYPVRSEATPELEREKWESRRPPEHFIVHR